MNHISPPNKENKLHVQLLISYKIFDCSSNYSIQARPNETMVSHFQSHSDSRILELLVMSYGRTDVSSYIYRCNYASINVCTLLYIF